MTYTQIAATSNSAGVYNLKKSYEHMYIPLASRPFGMFSWMWSVFIVQYDDIAEQCGMDAVTTIRLFEFGVKISLVAVLNSVYLFPIYKYLGNVVVDDNAKEFSLSNLPTSHPGLIATTIAAYIFFFAAMHFIDKVRLNVCAYACVGMSVRASGGWFSLLEGLVHSSSPLFLHGMRT